MGLLTINMFIPRNAKVVLEVLAKTKFSPPSVCAKENISPSKEIPDKPQCVTDLMGSADTNNKDFQKCDPGTSRLEPTTPEDSELACMDRVAINTEKVEDMNSEDELQMSENIKNSTQDTKNKKSSDMDMEDFDDLPDLVVETEKASEPRDEKDSSDCEIVNDRLCDYGTKISCQEPRTELDLDIVILNDKNKSHVVSEDNKIKLVSESDIVSENKNNDICDNSELMDCDNTNSIKQVQSAKKKKSMLSNITDLPSLPRLSGGPNSFIDFSKESGESQLNPEVSKLMDRFIKHNKKKEKKVEKDVDIR